MGCYILPSTRWLSNFESKTRQDLKLVYARVWQLPSGQARHLIRLIKTVQGAKLRLCPWVGPRSPGVPSLNTSIQGLSEVGEAYPPAASEQNDVVTSVRQRLKLVCEPFGCARYPRIVSTPFSNLVSVADHHLESSHTPQ